MDGNGYVCGHLMDGLGMGVVIRWTEPGMGVDI